MAKEQEYPIFRRALMQSLNTALFLNVAKLRTFSKIKYLGEAEILSHSQSKA